MSENQQRGPAEPNDEAFLDLLDINKMSETSGFHTPTLNGALDADRQRLVLRRGTTVLQIDLRSDIEVLTRYLIDHAGVEPLPDPRDFVFPAMPKKVRTAIVVDTNGQPGEIDWILEQLQEAGLSCELIIQCRGIQQVKDHVDLLILDYGGAAAFGSMELMEWQLEEARKYAEDHPSTLLVAWTAHTSRYYQEMVEAMPNLPNVLLRFEDTWHEQGILALQKWFSK